MLLPSSSFAIYRALSAMDLSSRALPQLSSLCTPMATGLDAPTLDVPPPDTLSSLEVASSPGHRSASPPFLGLVLRPSTVLLPTVSPRPPGCGNSYRNNISHCSPPVSSTPITLARSTSPPTPTNISAPTTWKLTFTLSGSGSLYIGVVHVLYVPTTSQFIDVFTKGLPSSVFLDFCSSLNVHLSNVLTVGRC